MSIRIETTLTEPPPGGFFSLQCIYDSATFVVVEINWTTAEGENGFGFEIADRNAVESVFLHGDTANAFQEQIERWRSNPQQQESVERALEAYSRFGRIPVLEQ